jgi:hypothetical protein
MGFGPRCIRKVWEWRASAVVFSLALCLAHSAAAQDFDTLYGPTPIFDDGRLLATGGVTALGGGAGGGLADWAVIDGYGSPDSAGITASATRVDLRSYTLSSLGAAAGLRNRVELSYAWLDFDTGKTGERLGLGNGYRFDVQGFGAKLRLTGDLVYDQDSWMPQTAIGVQVLANNRGSLLRALGARSAVGADFYLAATKLFLAPGILADATLRLTRANQFGILGFGGPRNNGYRPEFEGSLAWLAQRNIALGAEYRTAPDNLTFARQDPAYDLFAAWFAGKHASVTLAYVALGSIATFARQNGLYVSLQVGL